MAIQDKALLRAVFFGSTPFVIINFALPIRADDLGIDAVGIGLMYTVFTGVMLLFRPLVGYLLDRLGRRWFFTSAFVFYCLSMLAFTGADTLLEFCIARGLQGVGASLMWVAARTIIADLHDESSRGVAMGRLAATSARGSMMGAFYGFTLLGFLPVETAWLWSFTGYACAALLALVWAGWKLEESAPARAASETEQRARMVWTPSLAKIFVIVFLSMFASALIEPIYLIFLKNRFEVSVQVLTLVFFPAGLVFAILPSYAGAWSDRFGRGRIISIGITLAGLVSVALPYWPSLWLVAASYLLFAVGWAMASPAEEALVTDLAPAVARGRVIGAKEAAGGTGAALGPLAGGLLYEYVDSQLVFAINGALLLLTATLTLLWFGSKRER